MSGPSPGVRKSVHIPILRLRSGSRLPYRFRPVKIRTDSYRLGWTDADSCGYAHRVQTENGRPPEPDELPVVLKTIDQVAAWNVAYYRKIAGLTQEELGALIGGRSKRNVSADERSWDGTHTREFNARQIVALSIALGVPVVAFFLPPDDDGIDVRYEFRANESDEETCDMRDLLITALHDNNADTTVMAAYRWRFKEAVKRYLDPSWSETVDQWREDGTSPDIRAAQAAEARADRENLLRLAAKLARGIEHLENGDGK